MLQQVPKRETSLSHVIFGLPFASDGPFDLYGDHAVGSMEETTGHKAKDPGASGLRLTFQSTSEILQVPTAHRSP